ncbi:MAG: winged helix-turn-helix domain-containing protein [Euryarchaeota archaeon]|nr:winged helix-turn-helix domain-containing protein [Euryarchaeota archaeon]
MPDKIYLKGFPEIMRFKLTDDVRNEIFAEAFEKMREQYLDVSDLLTNESSNHTLYGQSIHEFVFGRFEGRILKVLEEAPSTGIEIVQKTGLSPNTFRHKIAELKRKGMIERRNGKYGFIKNPFDLIKFSEIGKTGSLAPTQRRKKFLSKNDVKLAIYLWPKYRKACAEVGISPLVSKYAITYHNIFCLANAIKKWRKGKNATPKWALIALTDLTQKANELNEEGIIQSYCLPASTPIIPFYNGKYKIPIEAGEDLDIIAIKLLAKGSANGTTYNHKNKEKFFERLHDLFGFFETKRNKGVPTTILEIIKKHYNIQNFDKKEAKIPLIITEKLEKLKGYEKIKYELNLLKGITELSSNYKGYFDLTSQSKDFLIGVSKIVEDLGLGKLTIMKKLNRPHYRCMIPSKKINLLQQKELQLKKLYENIERIYPDFEIWNKIPLNTIIERARRKDVLKLTPIEVLQQSCKEELSDYLGLILDSIKRNTNKYIHNFLGKKINTLELQKEMTNYYWNNKKIPSARSVKEYLNMIETTGASVDSEKTLSRLGSSSNLLKL